MQGAGPAQGGSALVYQKLFPAEYFDAFVAQGTRPDGRHLQQLRAASVRTGIVSTARSSAAAYIGATSVVAGVSMELAVPSLEAPDVGKAVCKVTLTPLATFEAHFSEANALSGALSHLLSEHLLSANVVDLSQLCIASGKHCWSLSLDIYVLNNDGCLLDACLAAGVAALADLKVPLATADSDSGKVQLQIEGDTEVTTPFKLLCQPRCLTAGLYQGQLVVDTTFQEQEIMAATMSVVVQDAQTLLGIHATSSSDIPPQMIETLAQLAADRNAS